MRMITTFILIIGVLAIVFSSFVFSTDYIEGVFLNFSFESGSGDSFVDSEQGYDAIVPSAVWTEDSYSGSYAVVFGNSTVEVMIDDFESEINFGINGSMWQRFYYPAGAPEFVSVIDTTNNYFRASAYYPNSAECRYGLGTLNGTHGNSEWNMNLNSVNVTKINIWDLNMTYTSAGAGCGNSGTVQLRIFSDSKPSFTGVCGGGGNIDAGLGTSVEIIGYEYDGAGATFNYDYPNLEIAVNPRNDSLYWTTDSWTTYATIDISELDDSKRWYLGIFASTIKGACGDPSSYVRLFNINYTQSTFAIIPQTINLSSDNSNKGSFNVSVRIKPNSLTTYSKYGGIVSYEGTVNKTFWSIYQAEDDIFAEFGNSTASKRLNATTVLTAGSWSHIVWVVDREDDISKLYIDDAQIQNTSISNIANLTVEDFNPATYTGVMKIGSTDLCPACFFNGTIDDLYVYYDKVDYFNVVNESYVVNDMRNGIVNYSFSFAPSPGVDVDSCFVGDNESGVYSGSQYDNECVVNFTKNWTEDLLFIPSFSKFRDVVTNGSNSSGVVVKHISNYNNNLSNTVISQYFIKEYNISSNLSSNLNVSFNDGVGETTEVNLIRNSFVLVNQSFSGDWVNESNTFYSGGSGFDIGLYYNVWKNFTVNNNLSLTLPAFYLIIDKDSQDFPSFQKNGSVASYVYNASILNLSIDSLSSGASMPYRYGYYTTVASLNNHSVASYLEVGTERLYTFEEQYVISLVNLSQAQYLKTSFDENTYLPYWDEKTSYDITLSDGISEISGNWSSINNTFQMNFTNASKSWYSFKIEYYVPISSETTGNPPAGGGGGGSVVTETVYQGNISFLARPILIDDTRWWLNFDDNYYDAKKTIVANKPIKSCEVVEGSEHTTCFVYEDTAELITRFDDTNFVTSELRSRIKVISEGDEISWVDPVIWRVVNFGNYFEFSPFEDIPVLTNKYFFEHNSLDEVIGFRWMMGIFGIIFLGFIGFVGYLWVWPKIRRNKR